MALDLRRGTLGLVSGYVDERFRFSTDSGFAGIGRRRPKPVPGLPG
jgi:hypothetical protein